MVKRAKSSVKSTVKRASAGSTFPKVASGELLTLLDFVRFAVSRFNEAKLVFAHGTTDPVAEAAFLISEALHLHPDQFDSFATARVTGFEAKKILELIEKRVRSRKPAAYLVNKIYMRGLPFYVDERVIVPRSYIGEILDTHFGGSEEDSAALLGDPFDVERVLDLCTGSGCVAISLARERTTTRVLGADVSPDALAVAAENMIRLGAYNVGLVLSDLFAAFGHGDRFDLITANPPYIAAGEIPSLAVDIRGYEPHLALGGGPDGLDFLRRIVAEAPDYLAEDGALAVEIGSDQGRAVQELFTARGFRDVALQRDYGGLDRVVSGLCP